MNIKLIGAAALACTSASLLSGRLFVSANLKGDLHDDHDYPRLLGAEVNGREPEITIIARSNGCTEKAQFEPQVIQHGERVTVGFQRISEDRCKVFIAEGKRLTWTFAELGIRDGADVRVLNDIGR